MNTELQPVQTSSSRPPLRILVLDDEPSTLSVFSHVLGSQGWEVICARNIHDASALFSQFVPDIALVDVYLGDEDGLVYVKNLRARNADLGIVVISAEDTQTLARKAIDSGADYFVSKPIAPAALILTITKMGEFRKERERTRVLTEDLTRSIRETGFPEIVTHGDAMRSVLRLIEKVGARDLSVLIFGESGTGKELVARGVHQNSPRASGPFIELNCAALPPNLVESELFGHEKGAFTGAIASRAGKIELANGGTLFLDEIGELPLDMQPKLLRALQEKRVTRVGGKRDIGSDFRLVSATNRDLLQEVKEGRFREDLFYRVAVFPIKLPPLRDRREDIELLLTHFLQAEGIRGPRVTPEAHQLLHRYPWPGNVRELKNLAQAIPLLTDGNEIGVEAITAYFGTRLGNVASPVSAPVVSMNLGNGSSQRRAVRKLEDLERDEILYALQVHRGNVPDAANALGMGRATLYKYLRKHNISQDDYA